MKKKILAFCVALVAFFAAVDATAQGILRRPQSLPGRSVPAGATAGAATSAPSDDTASDADPKEAPALNWDATPVDIVFQTYGEQVGKTILKDPAVPNATITLKSREGQKLSKEESRSSSR